MKKTLLIILLILSSYFVSGQNREDSLLNLFLKEWVGIPYRYGGKTKKGIDCSQLNKKLYKFVYNFDLPNISRSQYHATKRVSLKNLKKGDLVFFHSKTSPSKWHTGVYLGENKFIHASNYKTGVIISSLRDLNYMRRFISGGRLS